MDENNSVIFLLSQLRYEIKALEDKVSSGHNNLRKDIENIIAFSERLEDAIIESKNDIKDISVRVGKLETRTNRWSGIGAGIILASGALGWVIIKSKEIAAFLINFGNAS